MVSFAEAAELARTHLRADAGRLWGVSLAEVDWMGIADDTMLLTADPGVSGYELGDDGLWSGPLPDGVPVSNSPRSWAGRTWAGVVLPFGGSLDGAVRLLVHEAFHVVQDRVLPAELSTEHAEGMELLDTADGRVWLRMEVAALVRALVSPGAEQAAAAADVLLFRQRRLATATRPEADRERDLDLREGIPEYTAWKLTGASPPDVAEHARGLPENQSWVRSFAYWTGHAYGFLLDALRPGWQAEVARLPDLQALLAIAVSELRGGSYALDAAEVEEREREARHRERVERLRRAYTSGPLLRLPLNGQMISFNPQDVVPLDDGVHRGNLTWRNEDGSVLEASGGALVTPDFSEIRLACAERPDVPGTTNGDGWTLRLTNAWTVAAVDGGWKILRQQGD